MAPLPERSTQAEFYRPVHQSVLILFVTIAILGSLWAISSIQWVVLAALLGIGLGTLVSPIADSMSRRFKLPRALTSFAVLLVFFGAFFSVGYFLGTMISDEIVPVLHRFPSFLRGMEGKFPSLARFSQSFNFQKYFGGAAQALFSGVKIGASFLGGMVFIFFVALYFALQPTLYVNGLISAFPAHLRDKARSVVAESGKSLRLWFSAQLMAMLTVAVVASVALRIVGSPYWLFFGAIVFVLELVPYFGPITAFASVCLVTAAGDPSALVKTAVAFGVVLSLEGYVIVPLVMRGRVRLPPVHLLLLLTAMGEWFGIFGFLMAAPTLMVLRTVYRMTYLPAMDESEKAPSETPRLKTA